MKIALNYGRDKLYVELPADCQPTVIEKPDMPIIADPRAALQQALANPVNLTSPLSAVSAGANSACILICDITRPVPNDLILPVLLRQLLADGMTSESIKILVATGLHRPNEGAELAELIGDQVGVG